MKLEFGVPTDNSAPTIQFGLSRGAFEREGIELAIRPLHGGPALAAALDGGALKLALLGLLSLGSCDEWIARLILAKNALDPDRDVSFVALGSKYARLVDLIRDREIVARSVRRECGRDCLDGSIDLAGMAKAIAIQEELGTLARPLAAGDVLDRRFVPEFS